MTVPGAFATSGDTAFAQVPAWLILGSAALFGSCVGSFLNVCIYRTPRDGLSVARPRRSFCPTCGIPITWADNIPLWSWFRLHGRCRSCESPISSRYVVVEGLTAALFVLVAWRIVVTGEGSVLVGLALMALVAALVVASFIDLELRLLPDEITLGGLAAAVPTVLLVPELLTRMDEPWIPKALAWGSQALGEIAPGLPSWATGGAAALAAVGVGAAAGAGLALVAAGVYFRKAFPEGGRRRLGRVVSAIIGSSLGGMLAHHLLRPEWMESARALAFWRSTAGMLAGAGMVYLIGVVGTWVFRKQAMGFGDVKLMGLLGAFTGWLGVVQGFFVACLVGSVVGIYLKLRHRSQYIPFGPFLAIGCLLVLLWPGAVERAFDWYTGLFR